MHHPCLLEGNEATKKIRHDRDTQNDRDHGLGVVNPPPDNLLCDDRFQGLKLQGLSEDEGHIREHLGLQQLRHRSRLLQELRDVHLAEGLQAVGAPGSEVDCGGRVRRKARAALEEGKVCAVAAEDLDAVVGKLPCPIAGEGDVVPRELALQHAVNSHLGQHGTRRGGERPGLAGPGLLLAGIGCPGLLLVGFGRWRLRILRRLATSSPRLRCELVLVIRVLIV
mmetsp:Transcript_124993/g.361551  ORF Transcript_124993/g.361551 Transcript_124993/m.361551 type:complete len:224 (-) Transcript_124993:353-1024(-)